MSLKLSQTIALLGATLTMGLMASVFGLYAHTIMRGLGHTDDRTFVSAFQAIDRAIINNPRPLTEREFRGSKVTSVMFEQWYQRGVRFIVETNRVTSIQHDELRKLCRKYGYVKIFNNDAYLIYAAPPGGIAIAIDSETRQVKLQKQAARMAKLAVPESR